MPALDRFRFAQQAAVLSLPVRDLGLLVLSDPASRLKNNWPRGVGAALLLLKTSSFLPLESMDPQWTSVRSALIVPLWARKRKDKAPAAGIGRDSSLTALSPAEREINGRTEGKR
jgi:hypothetical protein